MSARRLPVRWRLTVVYGSLFFLAAVILVVVNHFVVTRIAGEPFEIDGRPVGADLPPESAERALFRHVAAQVNTYRDQVVASTVVWSILATMLVGLAGLAVGWTVARRALAPLRTVTEAARRLSDSTLHRRISMDGPDDEIRELADTFDSMLERLDRAFDGQRRFVANASHELRTPLAIDRALLQVSFADPALPAALRPVRDELLASNARQVRLIEGLLTLAHTERELTDREPVDLADLARAALAGRPEAGTGLAPAPAVGDAVLLERVIANLVDNAVKYNDERGTVSVRTGADSAGSFVTVENTGPEIAGPLVPRLFEPFRRLNDDRTGSASGAGLGLSIVRAVAHAHGGVAEAVPRDGGGLVVTVRLRPAEAFPGGDPRRTSPHGRDDET
ncbi:ATP-binding protein [Streptosporangium carneum]|uniref:histidine kinase n=1 Tax=Streptosporangium carneum TaxID=47481 RepID=A0A9W6I9B5_9ACTN|nr:ATP-binding protein [Streptosporangium carneum]GLK13568.1 two-component sensor histidine kinase [Streptosporangium carneum]